MQETPQPPHISATPYTVCNSYSATAPPPAGNSPPATPGLPPQPSSPPNPVSIRAQMQTPNPPMHSGYSQSIVSPATTTRSLVSPPELVPTFADQSSSPAPPVAGKGGDEFMFIMQDLMRQDCATNSAAAMSIHQKEMESHYMYSSSSYSQQLEGHVSSPYIPPVTSPSSASDQPCYSPITPVQSPLSASKSLYSAPVCSVCLYLVELQITVILISCLLVGSWTYIDQMLNSLYTSQQISQRDFQVSAVKV